MAGFFAPQRKLLSNQFFLDIKLLSDVYLLITSHLKTNDVSFYLTDMGLKKTPISK